MSLGLVSLFRSLGYLECDMPVTAAAGAPSPPCRGQRLRSAPFPLGRGLHRAARLRPRSVARHRAPLSASSAAQGAPPRFHARSCLRPPHTHARVPACLTRAAVAVIALAATAVESLPVNRVVDDNLSVPGVAAFLGVLFLQASVTEAVPAAAVASWGAWRLAAVPCWLCAGRPPRPPPPSALLPHTTCPQCRSCRPASRPACCCWPSGLQ